MNKQPSGYLLYQSSHVLAIITGTRRPSQNPKTGPMAQVWILPRAAAPVQAVASGLDRHVCGNCPLRNKGCYVTVANAPTSVYHAWQHGAYPPATDYRELTTRPIRFGAWGDPYFMPFSIIQRLAHLAPGFTGYTHQWRRPAAAPLAACLMASVSSPEDQIEATSQGWRTFRIKAPHQPLFADEILCPASQHRTTCARCRLCCGIAKPHAPNIAINAHGTRASAIDL